jgi:hypothetical protein
MQDISQELFKRDRALVFDVLYEIGLIMGQTLLTLTRAMAARSSTIGSTL